MKTIFTIAISFFCSFAYADTDGNICIKEEQISIEAKDIYFKVSEADKHTITFKNGNIEYSKIKENVSKNCLQSILLPFAKPQNIILVKNSKLIISLIISRNSQIFKEENGALILHHFVARVVKNHLRGDFIQSLILAEGTKIETVD